MTGVTLESGSQKKPARARKRPAPTAGDKAALRSVLALAEPGLAPHLEGLGLEVLDVALVSAGDRLTVRYTIDKVVGVPGDGKGGSRVTVDDCAAVSRVVSRLLDELDPGPGPEYSLEVSSPGLDRALKTMADFERFEGSLVKIKLGSEGGKNGRHTGRLAASPLRIVTDRGEIAFTPEAVISCRLVPEI
ncbi:MAG: ribosome maturation factor RimP [Deltaproteobacteria bacterium]|jgi:ribosome maturation factor RimP|nr:ribosome maturation factor RimP [Deltaproteobacteria bacterium]